VSAKQRATVIKVTASQRFQFSRTAHPSINRKLLENRKYVKKITREKVTKRKEN